jgi:hypothetical protein
MIKKIHLLLLFICSACAGSKPHGDAADLQSWVGAWRGVAIIENSQQPVAEWSLWLTAQNGRLSGRISSEDREFTQAVIKDIELKGDEMKFTFSFETSRGLQATQRHVAVRQGHKLLSLFSGREGGHAFRGRWEARYEP